MRNTSNQDILARCKTNAKVISCWNGEGHIKDVCRSPLTPDTVIINVEFENGTVESYEAPEVFRSKVLVFK